MNRAQLIDKIDASQVLHGELDGFTDDDLLVIKFTQDAQKLLASKKQVVNTEGCEPNRAQSHKMFTKQRKALFLR